MSLMERFWVKVAKVDGDGCWNWTGALGKLGYGNIEERSKCLASHRLSYEMAHGPIPKGMLVCHRCDNRACVRPDHLFLGTHRDNTRDMFAKDRWVKPRKLPGTANHQSVLTERDIPFIRELKDIGVTLGEVAKMYGVSTTTVLLIQKRRAWSHVP